MGQLFYYLFIVLFTFIIGFALIVCQNRRQENWIPKSFLAGASLLVLISFWISYLNPNGLRTPSKVIVGVLLALSILLFIVKKNNVKSYFQGLSANDLACLLFGIAAGIIPLTIYIIWGAQYPYCDGYTYICNADYLVDKGYNVLVSANDMPLHPWLSQIFLYQTSHFRIGVQMLLAFWTGVFNAGYSIELFLPLSGLGVLLCGMAAWSMISGQYAVSKHTRLTAVIMMSFNVPIILWCVLYGFLPQIIGSAFFLTGISYFMEWQGNAQGGRLNTCIAAIAIGSLALSYNEILPFLVISVLIMMISVFLRRRKQSYSFIKRGILCGILAIAVILPYFGGMIQAILSMFNASVGWYQQKDINTYLSYFFSVVPAEFSYQTSRFGASMLLYQIITILAFAMIVVGFYKAEKNIKFDFLKLSAVFIVMFFYFIFFTRDPVTNGHGNTWSIFKLTQYYFMVALPFISIFLTQYLKNHWKILTCFMAVFLTFNVFNALVYAEKLSENMEAYNGVSEASLEQYYDLSEKYGTYEGQIILKNVPPKHRQLITYFLKDVELVSDWSSDAYFLCIGKDPMVDKNSNFLTLYYNDNTGKLEETSYAITDLNGIYDLEKNETMSWRWSPAFSEMTVEKFTADALMFPLQIAGGSVSDCKLNIYVNDVLKQSIALIPNQFTTVSLALQEETNRIRFEYIGETIAPTANDPRELAFMMLWDN